MALTILAWLGPFTEAFLYFATGIAFTFFTIVVMDSSSPEILTVVLLTANAAGAYLTLKSWDDFYIGWIIAVVATGLLTGALIYQCIADILWLLIPNLFVKVPPLVLGIIMIGVTLGFLSYKFEGTVKGQDPLFDRRTVEAWLLSFTIVTILFSYSNYFFNFQTPFSPVNIFTPTGTAIHSSLYFPILALAIGLTYANLEFNPLFMGKFGSARIRRKSHEDGTEAIQKQQEDSLIMPNNSSALSDSDEWDDAVDN